MVGDGEIPFATQSVNHSFLRRYSIESVLLSFITYYQRTLERPPPLHKALRCDFRASLTKTADWSVELVYCIHVSSN
jgi:hypothetical protein